jgi:hypothetical protein
MGGGAARYSWSAVPQADRYDILRGEMSDPAGAACWTDHDPDPTDSQYVEQAVPAAGVCWFYLIRGVDDACGGPGDWGSNMFTNECP